MGESSVPGRGWRLRDKVTGHHTQSPVTSLDLLSPFTRSSQSIGKGGDEVIYWLGKVGSPLFRNEDEIKSALSLHV